MKKILFVILLCLCSNSLINAQLSIQTVEEAHNYQTVYECYIGFGTYMGEIRYVSDGFVLFGVTDNHYENSMASIYLGETKEEALETLEDLRKIVKGEKEVPKNFVVRGCNGKETQIYRSFGEWIISTKGVAGDSHILWRMSSRFEKAKEAVLNFNPTEK